MYGVILEPVKVERYTTFVKTFIVHDQIPAFNEILGQMTIDKLKRLNLEVSQCYNLTNSKLSRRSVH